MSSNEETSGPILNDAAVRSLEALAGDTLGTALGPARLVTWVQPTTGEALTTAVLPDGSGGWHYVCEGGLLGHASNGNASEGVGAGLPAFDALTAALGEAGLSLVPARHSRRHPELSGHWLGFLNAVELLPHWKVDLD